MTIKLQTDAYVNFDNFKIDDGHKVTTGFFFLDCSILNNNKCKESLEESV